MTPSAPEEGDPPLENASGGGPSGQPVTPRDLEFLHRDLALRDAYAMELRTALSDREAEVATLWGELATVQQQLAGTQYLLSLHEAELNRVRAAATQGHVELQEIRGRASYRLMARISGRIQRQPRLKRMASAAAQALTGSRWHRHG